MKMGLKNIEKTKVYSNDQYRTWFREQVIPKIYTPMLHLSFNLGTLTLVLLWHFSFITVWNWEVFTVIGLSLILGNLVVYLIHKYPLHRRIKRWSFPYDAHTVEHHRFFTHQNPVYQNSKDLFVVFFPWLVVLGFILVAQPFFFFSSDYIIGSELAHVFAGSTAGYFLLYEFVHWSSHLPKDHLFLKVPWLKYMWEHHRIHHNPRLMHNYNFCIVYPLFDILFGTKFKGEMPGSTDDDHYKNVKENLLQNSTEVQVESIHQ